MDSVTVSNAASSTSFSITKSAGNFSFSQQNKTWCPTQESPPPLIQISDLEDATITYNIASSNISITNFTLYLQLNGLTYVWDPQLICQSEPPGGGD